MDKEVVKLIEFQVKEGISEKTLCAKIGITSRTLLNIKKGKPTHEYTRQQIIKFIENGVQRESGSEKA